ncbi:cysteine-rich secretory protein family protein [Geobacter sp. OR-1]|uniref:CAP domain-containing protein n=1 Tax=Geobacter sp. OR-1 TaxID=1266765 RepID=UPI000543CD4B|nr:CAP domain-containing protein [Geobacter sp. OR-1]GAM08573.1 cysteine-rich secretory protein family protein [Geobacter sp. OR-1]
MSGSLRFCKRRGQALIGALVWGGLSLLLLTFTRPALAGKYEDDLLALINGYRAANSLKPLTVHPDYVALAKEQSRAMNRARRLSHDGFHDRFSRAVTVGANGCIENSGWNYQTANGLLAAWQKSPGHDRNLLDPVITGVGIARTGTYVTFFACY